MVLVGSSPTTLAYKETVQLLPFANLTLAQLEEHLSEEQGVAGSSPAGGAKHYRVSIWVIISGCLPEERGSSPLRGARMLVD